EALWARGTRAMVFRGRDGRDKITTSAPTDLWEVRPEGVTHYELSPEDFGVPRCAVEDLQGGSPQHNAQLVRQLVAGEPGRVRDAVLINAASGLTALDEDSTGDAVSRLRANMARAEESIGSGAAADVLQRWVAFTA